MVRRIYTAMTVANVSNLDLCIVDGVPSVWFDRFRLSTYSLEMMYQAIRVSLHELYILHNLFICLYSL